MLSLSRKTGEELVICGPDGKELITVKVIEIRTGKQLVKLGVQAPREIAVHRREVYEAIQSGQSRQGRDH